jgi:hypothetical protein
MTRPPLSPALLFLAAAVVYGCTSSNPTAPQQPNPNAGFVPLQLGDTWQSVVTQTEQITYTDGRPPPPPDVLNLSAQRSIVGTEEIEGYTYAVEELVRSDGDSTLVTWTRYRQDIDGLYLAAVSKTEPPKPTSALLIEEVLATDGERKRLQYPLENGATWAVTPTERATVEGVESLVLPIGMVDAYRIRVESAVGGPDNYVLWWYSGCGLVRFASHLVIRTFDQDGTPITINLDYVEELAAVSLTGEGTCGLAAESARR